MLHQRSESSPNFSASALGQAFHNLSLDQPQSPMLPSSNARRRLTKRQPSAVVLAKIDGRVLGSEADDPSAKTPHDEVPRRPPLPVRTSSSYSKRHASCNSPREVPLPPSPSIQRHNPFQLSADTDPHLKGKGVDPLSSITSSPFEHATNDSNEANNSLPSVSSMPTLQSPGHLSNLTLTDPRVRANHISSQTLDLPGAREMPENSHAPGLPSQTQGSSPLFPFSRPYSLPDAHSNSYGPATLSVSSTTNPSWPDRTSCASLPLPMQTPYFTLPQALSSEEGKESSQNGPIDPPGAEWLTKGKPEAKILDKTSVQRSGPRQPLDQTPSSPSGSVCFAPTAMPSTPSILSRCSSLSQSSNYPPPTPPTILAPSPPPGVEETRIQAPYEPFLSHAPPPEDSWIAVETTPSDYTLIVRLPGFKRDGITLATRRRRILHVVADSWEPNGGHFERRISFGYDADLTQVRAEFDGELLKIVIPRRLPPMNTWYPVGRQS